MGTSNKILENRILCYIHINMAIRMKLRPKNKIYTRLGHLKYIFSSTSIILVASLKADSAKFTQVLGNDIGTIITNIQTNAWWIVPIIIISVFLIDALRTRVGSQKDWKIIQIILKEYREKIFTADDLNDDPHHHRVTLFKKVDFYLCFKQWPWSGWLIPVARTGHTTRTSSNIFRVPDSTVNPEGIAGKTWIRDGMYNVYNLPDLHANPTEDNFQTYADDTFCSKDLVSKRIFGQRSYCGFPVEVNGNQWGVIVIDSYNSILRTRVLKQRYDTIIKTLDEALEGM